MTVTRTLCLGVLVALVFLGFSIGSTGGAPSGYSGAPGENNCRSCHGTYALNSGTAQFRITGPASLVGLTTVPLTVAFTGSASPRHGFQLTARTSAGAFAGTFVLTDPTHTAISGGNRVNQNSSGANFSSWTLSWTPPASLPAGPVTFYAAGVQGNGSGSSGDYVYTTSLAVYQASLSSATTTWPRGSLQTLNLSAPGHAAENYVVALSDATTPTAVGGSFVIPVDAYSLLTTRAWQLPAIYQNFVGMLDGTGHAGASVLVPTTPSIAGQTVYLAFVAVNPASLAVTEVSNRIAVLLQ